MELVILIVALVALGLLAMRYGADSRDLAEDTWGRSDTTHAQI